MMHSRTRDLDRIKRGVLAAAVLAVLASAAVHLSAQPPAPSTRSAQSGGLRVEISFSQAARAEPVTGMVYLGISRDNQSPPIQQADPEGAPIFSAYVEGLKP